MLNVQFCCPCGQCRFESIHMYFYFNEQCYYLFILVTVISSKWMQRIIVVEDVCAAVLLWINQINFTPTFNCGKLIRRGNWWQNQIQLHAAHWNGIVIWFLSKLDEGEVWLVWLGWFTLTCSNSCTVTITNLTLNWSLNWSLMGKPDFLFKRHLHLHTNDQHL